ncbi:GmrSD restriction endonuclease domain-containing protein [Cytobacillus horneckiae]|uniref:GmrSD restriction endonuclease domain-containing protein n=1 Tax=Cytobacillus horneckiae TaxID=549687 RepID=UPI003D9A3372
MSEQQLQQTESIKFLVDNIDKGNVVLPEFQRDFVWDLGKTYELFDSLVKDIFIGSIIYGKPSFEITVREIDKRPRKGVGSRAKLKTKFFTREEIEHKAQINNFRLVLDGQQRATSIYRALKGIDNVWIVIKNEEELSEEIQEKEFKDRTLEELIYEFAGHEDEDRLSVKISDAYAISNSDFFEDEIKDNYFNSLSFIVGMDESEIKDAFRKYLVVNKKLNELYGSEKLLSYYLLNMSTEKFALFFERSNSKGVQLNFIDILAAKLYTGFNLRDAIDKLQNSYHISDYKFNREIIVRTISYIVSNGKEVDRTYILSNLNYNHFNEYWDSVCNYYKKVVDFLSKGNFMLSQSWMPYENMIIPLMIFLKELDGNDFSQMNEKQHEFISYWYWSSIFSQRYSSGTNEVIIQDSTILSKIAKNLMISDKSYFNKIKIQMNNHEDILSLTKKGSAVYKGVLNFINFISKGLIDWNNSSKLSFNSKLEDHHIFPKQYIKENYADDENALSLMDCVANRTLLPKLTNIRIGKKAPSEYLMDIKVKNNYIEDSLINHHIPTELLEGMYDDFYWDFVETRAKNMYELIEVNIIHQEKQILDNFYQAPIISNSGNIKVFATYYNTRIEATFDIDTEKILYRGKTYSVSAAANKVKEELSDKNNRSINRSTNGWKFWKYITDLKEERFIDDFRKTNILTV